MVVELILYLLALATAVPAGLLLAWLCDDELVVFRRYMLIVIYAAVILAILLSVLYFNLPMILSLVYSIIVFATMVAKGYRMKKKR